MRLTDGERDRLLEWLGRCAALGAIDAVEHERRAEIVLRAPTREAALAVLADLPAITGGELRTAPRGRGRGHGEADAPQPDWRPTDERFRDPRTGRVMRVWIDSAGGRHYLAEPPEGPTGV